MNELPEKYTLGSMHGPSDSPQFVPDRMSSTVVALTDSVALLARSVASLEKVADRLVGPVRTDDTSEDLANECQTKYGTMSFAGVKRGPIAGDEIAQAMRTLGNLSSQGFNREYIANALLAEFAMKRGIL